jgi:hypothetical protein
MLIAIRFPPPRRRFPRAKTLFSAVDSGNWVAAIAAAARTRSQRIDPAQRREPQTIAGETRVLRRLENAWQVSNIGELDWYRSAIAFNVKI